jgi:glycosyltransferase involved in cell wall biosynthesis
MSCHLSIVIPTFNRAHLIIDSIPILMSLEFEEEKGFEVIFVSNGSSDNTMQVLADAAKKNDNLRSFEIAPSGGPAAPRNKGIKEASGSIIVILDDDVIPDADMLIHYTRHHKNYPAENEAVLGVAYVPEHVKTKPVSLFHEFNYTNLGKNVPICYTYFWTCNISFKRDFMLQNGMFDKLYLYNEDIVCGYKLAQAGMTLRFEEKAKGQHLHQLKLEDVALKGRFVGKWIWATAETTGTPQILDRYGVLAMNIGFFKFIKRVVNRIGFWLLDNAMTLWVLEVLGAKAPIRSKVTDFYYYLIYRKQILLGFKLAKNAYILDKKSNDKIDVIQFVRDLEI